MKVYLVFAGAQYYPLGGQDLHSFFSVSDFAGADAEEQAMHEACNAAEELVKNMDLMNDWSEVYVLDTADEKKKCTLVERYDNGLYRQEQSNS